MSLVVSGQGVILSPHPDDAVLSAFSLLTSSEPVQVIDVCTGLPDPGSLGTFDGVFGVSDSRALMRDRMAEDERALGMLGRAAIGLGFLDDQYRTEPKDVELVRSKVADLTGGHDWIAVPAGIGAHPDHLVVRDVGLALARDRGQRVLFYADLPYAIWAGWPHWVTGEPARRHLVPEARWRSDLASIDVGDPDRDLVPIPVALDPDSVDRKIRALQCYVTQFEVLNAGPIERLRNPEIIPFELYWSIRARR